MTLELDPYDAAALALADRFDWQVSYPDGIYERLVEVRVTARIWLTIDQYTEWQKGVSNG